MDLIEIIVFAIAVLTFLLGIRLCVLPTGA